MSRIAAAGASLFGYGPPSRYISGHVRSATDTRASAQRPAGYPDPPALAGGVRPARRGAGGAFRARIRGSDLGLPRRNRACGAAERGATAQLPPDAVARTRPGRMAAYLRHRGIGGAALSHRRAGKSVLIPLARAGLDLGNGAAAAHDAVDRHLRHVLRHRAGFPALRSAVGQRGSAGTSGNLYGRRLALDPARDRLYRRLYLAGRRGGAPAFRRTGGDRACSGARTASVSA